MVQWPIVQFLFKVGVILEKTNWPQEEKILLLYHHGQPNCKLFKIVSINFFYKLGTSANFELFLK